MFSCEKSSGQDVKFEGVSPLGLYCTILSFNRLDNSGKEIILKKRNSSDECHKPQYISLRLQTLDYRLLCFKLQFILGTNFNVTTRPGLIDSRFVRRMAQ